MVPVDLEQTQRKCSLVEAQAFRPVKKRIKKSRPSGAAAKAAFVDLFRFAGLKPGASTDYT
jgi:hypothetical protein